MIIGQVFVNGISYSAHRFPDAKASVPQVRRRLGELVRAEQLDLLGTVEVRVHAQSGLDRLMAALLGLEED